MLAIAMRSIKISWVIMLLTALTLGGCDDRTAAADFDRQISRCTVAERNGLLDSATQACGQALALAEGQGDSSVLISDLRYRLGRLERQRGRFQEAEGLVKQSLDIEEKQRTTEGVATRLIELSLILAGQNRWADGAQLLERASPLAGDLTEQDRKAAANAFRAYSARLDRLGNTATATRFKSRAAQLAENRD